jgi:hypothetical protein
MNWYEKTKQREVNASSEMIRIRKRTTLGSLFEAYIRHLALLTQKESSELSGATLEVRGAADPGFRFTKFDATGESITFFVDCSFNLAPEYVKISIKGAKGTQNFSDTLRLFLTDDAMIIARRLAGRIRSA